MKSFIKRTIRNIATVLFTFVLISNNGMAANILVFGDSSTNRDRLDTDLKGMGHSVTNTLTLPGSLSSFDTIWHVGAFVPLTAAEQTRLIAFINSGKGVHLTGERRACCYAMNNQHTVLLNNLVTAGGVTIGNQDDIPGPYLINGAAVASIATSPNTITNWCPNAPGGLAGVSGSNVLVTGSLSRAVGAAWDSPSLNGGVGRVSILMDVNWFISDCRLPIIENIELFLESGVSDQDNDGIPDTDDNCPKIQNSDQANLDGDGEGDACDDDIDGDTVLNTDDNCDYDVNPGQEDFDADGEGDVCDFDSDGDEVSDAVDACVPTPIGEIVDATGCSIDELCPCDNLWKNHGTYVKCISYTSNEFVAAGLITGEEKDVIVSNAANSSCGK